jgi:hypothetical protein
VRFDRSEMIKRYLLICVYLFAVADVAGQRPAKPVKQPPEVIEAYRVVNEFQRLLAENLDFDRAYEATFTKDQELRREIAVAEAAFGEVNVDELNDTTVIWIYKMQCQMMILVVPLLYGDEGVQKSVMYPPRIEEIFERKPPKDLRSFPTYVDQLKDDLRVLRAHFDNLVVTQPTVREKVEAFKKYLLTPHEPPNHVVKPLNSYSVGRVLPIEMKYYKVADFAVVNEGGHMRIIGFRLFHMRW